MRSSAAQCIVSYSAIKAAEREFGVPVSRLGVERQRDGSIRVTVHVRGLPEVFTERLVLGELYEELAALGV